MFSIKCYIKKYGNYLKNIEKDEQEKKLQQIISFDMINNEYKKNNNSILFVVPSFSFGSGGLTSISRIASKCQKEGYNVFFYDYSQHRNDKNKEIAKKNFNEIEYNFLNKEEVEKNNFDIVVASNWQSVYYAKKINGYKIYFVQDYEPFFSNVSADYFLSKKTYELGFHIISLGKWNIDQIKKYSNEDIKYNWIDFPYNPKEYTFVKRDYSSYKCLKEIKFAIYIKRENKRIPGTIKAFIELTNEILKNKGIKLIPYYFGLNPREKVNFGTNLGKLSKKELNKLYHKCHFGMVASLTNISLVPLEMLGTGLPIFEFKDGSFESFLGNETATLLELNYQDFADKLLMMLNNPSIIEKQIEKAQELLKNLTWEKTCNQFCDILKCIEEQK